MLEKTDRRAVRQRVKKRIRKKLSGTADRPRLSVFRSLKHIYAQAVDDSAGRTIAAASTAEPEVRALASYGGNTAAARLVGAKIAERLLATGRARVVFDRSGYIYHGRVKALAEAAREQGLKF